MLDVTKSSPENSELSPDCSGPSKPQHLSQPLPGSKNEPPSDGLPASSSPLESSSLPSSSKSPSENKRTLSPEQRAQIVARNTIWTPEQDAVLAKMREEGISFSWIAKTLGCSRNAAIGRALRIKLPRTRPPPMDGLKRRRPRGAAARHVVSRITRPPRELPQAEPSKVAAMAFGEPCELLELKDRCCHWPLTPGAPFLFCNAAAPEGQPYCDQHLGCAYK